MYLIRHLVAPVKAVPCCPFLFRRFRRPGLIHSVGGVLPAFLGPLHRRVCGIFLIAQLIRVIILCHGHFRNGVALAVTVFVFPAVFLIGSLYIGGRCGVQISKPVIRCRIGQGFRRTFLHIRRISDDCVSAWLDRDVCYGSVHPVQASLGAGLPPGIACEETDCRYFRLGKVTGFLKGVIHVHGERYLACVRYSNIIVNLVTAEEPVLVCACFRRRKACAFLLHSVLRFRAFRLWYRLRQFIRGNFNNDLPVLHLHDLLPAIAVHNEFNVVAVIVTINRLLLTQGIGLACFQFAGKLECPGLVRGPLRYLVNWVIYRIRGFLVPFVDL